MSVGKLTALTMKSKQSPNDLISAGDNKLKLLNSQSQNNMKNLNIKFKLQENKLQKINKRNYELMKLFRPTPHQQFNLQILEKSQFMENNQIFNYLVQSLKKQRQGMITYETLSQEKAKDPKPIQNKIRQFLYNSLQQSLLMSQKQIRQTKFFQKLFEWFTDVFKQRQMKLSFKKQPVGSKDPQYQDQDWYIRNTFKSNMPFELVNYQRKMFDMHQIKDSSDKLNSTQAASKFSVQENLENLSYSHVIPTNSNKFTNYGGIKAFSQPTNNSFIYEKTNSILPVIDRKNLMSNLYVKGQIKEKQQLQLMLNQWKKNKAQQSQHLTKKYYKRNYSKDKVLLRRSQDRKQKMQLKQNGNEFRLNKSALQKVQAARFGVSLIDFRKNKQNLDGLKSISSNESRVSHPYLTSNYFNDIKRKKLEKIQKDKSYNNLKYKPSRQEKTQEPEDSSTKNIQQLIQNQMDMFQLQNKRQFNNQVEGIDGIGLTLNPFEKIGGKAKKT